MYQRKEVDLRVKRTLSPETMLEMYTKDDHTLQSIADASGGLTRERVRQLIGSVAADAPLSARKVFAKMDKLRATDKSKPDLFWTYYGCRREEVISLGDPNACGSIPMLYKTQKNTARQRGIEWSFTLRDWYEVWVASGHFPERGRGKNKYVMSRIADQGRYSPDNVVIKTNSENVKEARQMDRARGNIRLYEHNGLLLSISEWGKELNISALTLRDRFKRMSPSAALAMPLNVKYRAKNKNALSGLSQAK